MKLLSLLFFFNSLLLAQVDTEDALYITLKKLDAELFEKGFNQCQLDANKNIVTDDLEFYHDKGGFQDKTMFLNAMNVNICSTPDHKPIRKLINNSLEVFPLYKDGILYAALQKGVHEFYIKEPNKEIYPTGVARFTHLWIKADNQWQLKRIFSYDHNPIEAKFEKLNAHYPMGLFDTDSGINSLLKQHHIPSIGIGIINYGKLQQIRLFGDKKLGSPVSYNSIYKVASLTKPIVALLTLKLIDSGKLGLDEPLYKYYIDPDIKDTEEVKLLTPRIILSHQTGFPNWRYLDKSNILKFEFKPGTKYQYSGEGFEFLRKALVSKFNKPIEQLAQEHLFEPLNMQDTHFTWDKDMDVKRYAQEHDEMGKPIDFKKHTKANAAANLLTTIEDYSKFMVHILDGAGISKKLYQEMISKQVNEKPGIDFGLGWEIFNDVGQGEFALQHTGGDYGIKALALLLPKSKRGIVIFVNSENGIKVWGKIIREYFGEIGEKIIDMNKQ
jgi:CubicO group peptidase (beta-lactamase class C family)